MGYNSASFVSYCPLCIYAPSFVYILTFITRVYFWLCYLIVLVKTKYKLCSIYVRQIYITVCIMCARYISRCVYGVYITVCIMYALFRRSYLKSAIFSNKTDFL